MPLGTRNLRSSSSCVGVLSWSRAAPQRGAGQGGAGQAPGKRIVGPGSTRAVQQYSVVRRAWGPGGVAIFLNRSAYTPLRSLMGVLLTTPVRCTRTDFAFLGLCKDPARERSSC